MIHLHTRETFSTIGVYPSAIEDMLQTADYVSIHTPLTKDTHNLISKKELSCMKSTVFVINMSRGSVVNENSLFNALKDGTIRGAALDELENEPPDFNNPLLALDNLIVTPHTASYSEEAILEMLIRSAEQVVWVINNQLPENIVNEAVLEQFSQRFGLN